MKKVLLLFLALTFTIGSLTGCDMLPGGNSGASVESTAGDNTSEEKKTSYFVTFTQEGQADIIKEVEEGKALTDIPTPVQKVGYTTKWSLEDFSSVTENINVTAVATPNQYTITYDAGEGAVTPTTQTVTYDAIPESFATPTSETHNFICWTYEGKAVQATEAWKIADDVTLVASWVAKEKRAVTFVQDGYEPIVVEVVDGGVLTGDMIPETQEKTGYTVVWEEKIPSQITENIIINAVATPNTYYITYDAGEGDVDMELQAVVYDSAPKTFAVATREGYKFKGWEYNGVLLSESEAWKIADNVTLTAKWAKMYTVTLNANGGSLKQTTITVVQGEAYTLPIPTRTDYEFTYWKYGSVKVAISGIWSIDGEEIVLSANWVDEGWTGNY